ncbi:MAG: TatD family hydrolase [Opitutales bacterium]|nr:TatD family hydrolase [Opitutales bacterium]
MLIDSHCHLESFYRKGLLAQTLANATAAGVQKLITVGTSPEDWALYSRLSKEHPGQIYWTAGLHPCDVGEDWHDAVMQLGSWFTDAPLPVALGEIGLDHFHLPKDDVAAQTLKQHQVAAFTAQLELALQLDCPVVIHSRNAFKECVELIDCSGVDWTKVVFHCFSEGAEEMRLLNERGGCGSFTGVVTYKNAPAIREAALLQGLDKLMVETDSPYLTPMPHRGKPNEPAYVQLTAQFLADLFEITLAELEARSTENATRFFGL